MGVGEDEEQDFLSELAKDVESLRHQVLKLDQIGTQASNAAKITELENQISALRDRVNAVAKKSEEGRTLKELVQSFFTGVDSHATKISAVESQILALENLIKGSTLNETVGIFLSNLNEVETRITHDVKINMENLVGFLSKLNEVESRITHDVRINIQNYVDAKIDNQKDTVEGFLSNLNEVESRITHDVGINMQKYVDALIDNQKETVGGFLSNLTEVEKKITKATAKKMEEAKVEIKDYLKIEMDRKKEEWKKEITDSQNEVTLLRIKIYGEEIEKILKQGKKHLKEADKSSKSIPSKTSMFSLIIGGLINMQTIKRNPEYFWLLIVLTITMFVGTFFIIVMSYMKLKKTQNDLLKLEEHQSPFYVEVNQFLEDIKSRNQDKSTMMYWVIKAFEKLAGKRETYKKLSWSYWFSLGIFSVFSAIVPLLLLIDTIINANSPPTTWGSLLFMNNRTF